MKILLAVDQSGYSEAAKNALISQMQATNAEVCVLNVVEPSIGEYQSADVLEGARKAKLEYASQLTSRLAAELKNAGFASQPVVEEGDATHSIVEFAEKWHPDYVFLGSHGRTGWKRVALGSVSEAVAHKVPCSVVIVRSSHAH
jgi:nucleotide-binding universal stress UspA family protein